MVKYPTFLKPLDARLSDWITEFIPSRNPLVALAENQLSTPSRSSRIVLAATFIRGTFECMTHESARSSSPAASSRVAHE